MNEYSNYKRNPYLDHQRSPVTINLSKDVVDHFRKLADETQSDFDELIDIALSRVLLNQTQNSDDSQSSDNAA